MLWRGADLQLIPTSALFKQGEGWAVFVAEGGRARLKQIQVGQRNGLTAQVLGGLKLGDQVIAHPDDKIADGDRRWGQGEGKAELGGWFKKN